MIPTDLLKFAQIDKDVHIRGAFKYIEIWSEELYLQRRASQPQSSSSMNEAYMAFHKAVNQK